MPLGFAKYKRISAPTLYYRQGHAKVILRGVMFIAKPGSPLKTQPANVIQSWGDISHCYFDHAILACIPGNPVFRLLKWFAPESVIRNITEYHFQRVLLHPA